MTDYFEMELAKKADRAANLLRSIVDAYDAGCVQLSSQDIQFDDEHLPHPWHEEWLADARRALAHSNGDRQ